LAPNLIIESFFNEGKLSRIYFIEELYMIDLLKLFAIEFISIKDNRVLLVIIFINSVWEGNK